MGRLARPRRCFEVTDCCIQVSAIVLWSLAATWTLQLGQPLLPESEHESDLVRNDLEFWRSNECPETTTRQGYHIKTFKNISIFILADQYPSSLEEQWKCRNWMNSAEGTCGLLLRLPATKIFHHACFNTIESVYRRQQIRILGIWFPFYDQGKHGFERLRFFSNLEIHISN